MLVNHLEAQQEILDLLLGLRKAGVAFNSVSVRSVIVAVLEERAPSLLSSNGGSFQASCKWTLDFVATHMNWRTRCV